MNPNQQPFPNPNFPSPYRNNHHINPAESKIVYKNPQHMPQPLPHNPLNLVSIQNPQTVPLQYVNTPPQFNPAQFPVQPQLIQNQPQRSRSLSPLGSIPPQNLGQRALLQSPPPPQNMIFSFDPNQPQQLLPGQQVSNQPIPQFIHGRPIQSTPPPGHYVHQNSIPVMKNQSQGIRATSPSDNTRVSSNTANSSNVTFKYQNKLSETQNTQNPIMMGLFTALQKSMVSSGKPILQSAININLDTIPPRFQQSAININMNSRSPNDNSSHVPAQNLANPSVNHQVINGTKSSENEFHLTSSYDLEHQLHQHQEPIKPPEVIQVPPPALPKHPAPILQTSENYTENVEQGPSSPSPIWEQRFMMIYQKFEWFYERYDFISREFQILSQEFENVNSEDEWLELKEKHDLLLEKIQQIQEELVNTIHQNQELAQQYELENRNSKESDEVERVWEHRYHELLEEYKSLSQNYADLQSQGNQNTSQSQHSQGKGGMSLEEQAEVQSKFHELESEYNVLCDEYEKIRVEYERIYEENTQYSKENSELVNGQEQARNMASHLQAYVEELQHQNDQLRKQERKSTPSQDNLVSREEVEKMQYHYGQEIQKYEEELQKYRMAQEQYQQRTEMNRQELQKLSQIVVERETRIRQLEINQNSTSKSGHSNNIPQNQNHDLERRYVNILEQDVKLWREKQTDFLHKIQMKDMERRSLEEKIHYLEKELDIKKMELEKIGKSLNQKLSKIEQNTSGPIQGASRHVIEQEIVRPLGSTHYEGQISELQAQLYELQTIFNSKMATYRELEESITHYEAQLRKQSNAQSMNEIEFQKRISEVEIEMNRKVAQKDMRIIVLNSQIERLKDVAENFNREKSALKESLRAEFQANEKQLNQRHRQRVSELQQKIDEKSGEMALIKEILQKAEKEIRSKNQELIELRSFVTQMKKSTSQTNISASRNDYQLIKDQLKLKQEMLERKNDELSKIKREKEYKIKHITELEHELQEVNSELSKRRTEVSSLKRQLNDLQTLESDYETLKSNLNKKVTEVNQLKQEVFEVEKLRMENDSQKRDLERFVQENKERYKEIERLKEENYELQKKIAFTKNNINNQNSVSRHSIHDDSEVTELRELIRKKDSEISRINQTLQESQYSLENKSRELEMQKAQFSTLTKSKESEVSSLTHNVSSLESRLKDSETKRNKLAEEINELRAKFEEQLKSESQRQKSYYDKVIVRYEDDYKALKQKLRASQESCNKMELELQKSKTSEKNLQIQISQLNKKISSYQSQTLEKQDLYSQFRQKQAQSEQSTKALYEKLSALELQLKTKEQQMKLSEEKNAILEQKIKKNKKDYENFRNKLIVSQEYENNNSVVEYLSKRIAEYESKMINQSERDFGFKVKDQEANHVFENQVVYHLKLENEMLRKELQGKGIQYDRKVLNQLEEENLKRSKNLLRNSAFSSKLGPISSNLLIKDNFEDVNFYKEKNKELQERVEKHLKCNKQLKEKIQALIKNSSSQPKEIHYYKQQIAEYEHKITQLEKKVQSLAEENKNIGKGMSRRQSRVQEHFGDRVKELESRLAQSSRTIEQLTQQKSQLEIAKSQLQMQKVTLNDQIKRLNQKISTLQTSKNQKYEQQVIQLRERCEQYESEITKTSNRARILEEEIKRLNETNNSSKLSLNELNTLKVKIQELTNALTKAERDLNEEQSKSSGLTNEIASLQLKCRTWESETERLKEMNELYAKKQRNDLTQSSVLKQSTSSLQSQITTLQTQLSTLSSQNQELQARLSGLIQQLKYYEGLIPSLVYDLEFVRSDTLLEESLIEEMVIGGENTVECISGLRVNVQRKLYWLDQLFNKVRKY